MSTALVNNNYVGDMNKDFATLVSIGATDTSLFHVMYSRGRKLRFPYLYVATSPEGFTSICALTDNSSSGREVVDVELIRAFIKETVCNDMEFGTDWANAENGILSQKPDPEQVAEWAMMHGENFMLWLQDLRWSGDTASSNAALTLHDGIVKKIQAKNAYDASTNINGYQKVATTTVTASNAIQEIRKVVAALPLKVRMDPGFKIVISGTVEGFLEQQTQATGLTVGLASLPVLNYDVATGKIVDKAYFGGPVYVAAGLDATVANSNIIMAGIFEDSRKGQLKLATLDPMEGENVVVTDLEPQFHETRLEAVHAQNVAVIPNLSQLAMNA
jgi:hypothetical protein